MVSIHHQKAGAAPRRIILNNASGSVHIPSRFNPFLEKKVGNAACPNGLLQKPRSWQPADLVNAKAERVCAGGLLTEASRAEHLWLIPRPAQPYKLRDRTFAKT